MKSTLSSRDHYGCVEIHDSFEYDSPWYAITALQFFASLNLVAKA